MQTFDDLRRQLRQENPEEFYKLEIVGKLMAARDRKGLSQRELSRISGIPQKTISRIESGKDIPKMSTLFKLCSALDLEIQIIDKNVEKQHSAAVSIQS